MPINKPALTAEDLHRRTDRPLRLFLSCPRSGTEICEEICYVLRDERGHDVWFDQERDCPGEDRRRKIAEGIDESGAPPSCLSRDAVPAADGVGGVCPEELSIAVSVRGCCIAAVLLEPEKEANPDAVFASPQWLDMSAWKEKKAAGEAVFRPWFDRMMLEILRMIECGESYAFDWEMRRIRERLAGEYGAPEERRALCISYDDAADYTNDAFEEEYEEPGLGGFDDLRPFGSFSDGYGWDDAF